MSCHPILTYHQLNLPRRFGRSADHRIVEHANSLPGCQLNDVFMDLPQAREDSELAQRGRPSQGARAYD